ncbi:hypothetical protein HDU86_004352 [Geranomyces michiganensis]|nr:hypothetical protein HDU86_004352 [Geranomyces michiganensis]
MTRVTKLARKTHEEASGFSVTPLLPSAPTPAAAASTKPVSAPIPSQSEQPPPSKKRKDAPTSDTTTASITETAAESALSQPNASSEQGKKKRVRHRTKEEAAEVSAARTTAAAAAAGGERTGYTPAGGKALTKQEKDALRRRTRRERNREKKLTCFLCRNPGHSINTCPKASESANSTTTVAAATAALATPPASGICYKCGSVEHKSSQCRQRVDPKNPYPFAHCFVCNKTGHIAGACPDNDRGLYPNGGGCKYCGSVRHFARDCKPAQQEAGVTTLGKIDLRQGGDDDDVFVALQKMDEDKTHVGRGNSNIAREKASSKAGLTMLPSAPLEQQLQVAPLQQAKKAKKVVKF